MKKLLSVALCLVLIFSALPMFAISASAATSGYYTYTVSNGKATITDCSTSISGAVTIPSELGGYPVTSIAANAFSKCGSNIKELMIPDCVTYISRGALSGCVELGKLTTPYIGQYGGYLFTTEYYDEEDYIGTGRPGAEAYFKARTSAVPTTLKELIITNGNTLDDNAFYCCTNLQSVALIGSTTSVPYRAFIFCTSLQKVIIGDKVKYIGKEAFQHNHGISEVYLGKEISTIYTGAFGSSGRNVYYRGSQQDKENITIESNNYLNSATWYYNCCIDGVTSHSYDDCLVDADCNVCGDVREVIAHYYDNACDVNCNFCGDEREVSEHTYDNACDTDCNECGNIRAVADHVYDDTCDTDCNVCGSIRDIYHTYDNDCDTECNICGNTRQTTHIYDDQYDAYCNICGDIRGINLPNANVEFNATTAPIADDWIFSHTDSTIGSDSIVLNGGNVSTYLTGTYKDTFSLTDGFTLTYAANGKLTRNYKNGVTYMGATVGNITAGIEITNADKEAAVLTVYIDGTAVATSDVIYDSTHSVWDSATTNAVNMEYYFGYYLRNNSHLFTLNYNPKTKVITYSLTVEGTEQGSITYTDTNDTVTLDYATLVLKSHGTWSITTTYKNLKLVAKCNHSYDNACDTECNICGDIRTITHNYDNVCDADCNICGNIREAHIYDNACDTDCNECGSIREAHIYDDIKDTDCNECGAVREIKSGTCGANVEWVLDTNTGVLTLTGTGATYNYVNVGNTNPFIEHRANIKSIVIGDGITRLGNRLFRGLTQVESVTFGKDVANMGYEVFYSCLKFKDVTLNEGLTTLGALTFYGCTSLKQIAIPSTVTNLQNRAFKGSGLTSVVVPDTVTSLGYEVFMNCYNLATVDYTEGVSMLNPRMFENCTSLKTFNFTDNMCRIRSRAFYGCTALESITFENADNMWGSSSGEAKIASNAFNDSNPYLKLVSNKGDHVENYCYRFGYTFEAK